MSSKEQPLSWPAFAVLVLISAVLACWYRFPDLGLRPMHLDEAILGVKFIDFWKNGWFQYDPSDYHGPALHYITRVIGAVLGWSDPAALTDIQLRLAVAICGLVLVLLTLSLTDALGRQATAVAMVLMAVSPIMVFYSRYFIMEVPFVLFLMLFMVSVWRFAQSRKKVWLLVAGASLGVLHATKETFVINVFAMGCGWVVAYIVAGGFTQRSSGMRLSFGRSRNEAERPWLWVLVSAILVSVALYSGFFRHWNEVLESVTTYGNYLKRSGGAGHEKPWYYYITLLAWYRDFFLWSELAILLLAVLGMLRAFFGWFNKDTHKQAFQIFLSVYALVGLLAYSIIPYKTPWTILSIHHVFILLAGVGVQWLYSLIKGRFFHTALTIGMTAVVYHLCAQTMQTLNDRGTANMRAPYVYSHTSTSAMQLVQRIKELSTVQPESFSLQVVQEQSGWPLGWYLRELDGKAGYHTTMPADLAAAPVYVVDSKLRSTVAEKFPGVEFVDSDYGLWTYVTAGGLKENVNVKLLVQKALWDAWQAGKSQGGVVR